MHSEKPGAFLFLKSKLRILKNEEQGRTGWVLRDQKRKEERQQYSAGHSNEHTDR